MKFIRWFVLGIALTFPLAAIPFTASAQQDYCDAMRQVYNDYMTEYYIDYMLGDLYDANIAMASAIEARRQMVAYGC